MLGSTPRCVPPWGAEPHWQTGHSFTNLLYENNLSAEGAVPGLLWCSMAETPDWSE